MFHFSNQISIRFTAGHSDVCSILWLTEPFLNKPGFILARCNFDTKWPCGVLLWFNVNLLHSLSHHFKSTPFILAVINCTKRLSVKLSTLGLQVKFASISSVICTQCIIYRGSALRAGTTIITVKASHLDHISRAQRCFTKRTAAECDTLQAQTCV